MRARFAMSGGRWQRQIAPEIYQRISDEKARRITARFAGTCSRCNGPIAAGEQVRWADRSIWHETCCGKLAGATAKAGT